MFRRWLDRDHFPVAFPGPGRSYIRDGELLARIVLRIGAFDIFDRHRIRHGIVEVHEGSHVHPLAAQARHFLETASFRGLIGRCVGNVHRAPGIEIIDAHFPHLLRHQIAQHEIHLGHGIADRRACEEGNRCAGPFAQRADFKMKVHRLLRAGLVAHAGDAGKPGRVGEVLELVRFIDREIVDSHFLEREEAVAAGVAKTGEAVFEFVDKPLGFFDPEGFSPSAALPILRGFLFGFLDGLVGRLQFLF